ncbi:tetrahydrofolate dehydrogenase/cyclohydrolase catalytic domain-containing protein, partial [Streptomyces sp. FxanaA7]|uniref:tetrahydrofolate dehydrogenase/cyclohydrolase catalytic domain-containing protein n=1 Tax=Streptomyces sp. FxanaA7 TaxID=1265492 RepID=UPI0005EDDF7B
MNSTAAVIDGNLAAKEIKEELSGRIDRLTAAGRQPGLGTILVGDDPASRSYVAGKHRDCADVGIRSFRVELPAGASQRQ